MIVKMVGLAVAMAEICLAAEPTFEVVSIRPSGSTRDTIPMGVYGVQSAKRTAPFVYSDHRLTCDLPLGSIIKEAYGVTELQIVGPEWLYADTFAVAATMPADTNREYAKLMLRTVLRERFGLKFRREERILPVYALLEGKGGFKLEAVDDPEHLKRKEVTVGGTSRRVSSFSTDGRFVIAAASLPQLAESMTHRADRPVVDLTGMKGQFAIDVQWLPGDRASENAIFLKAVQQQLGIRLEKRDLPYEMFLIDDVQRVPTEN